MPTTKKMATASVEAMLRIFTIPEAQDSTLGQIEQRISQNLDGFLTDHIVTVEKPLREIEKDFSQCEIPEQPTYVSDHAQELMDKLVAHSVHTASPGFVGHMTSALPYFLLPLSKLMVGLNQNLVKIETSKAFTPLERQVLGMMHHLAYQQDEHFYQQWMHSAQHSLGAFCSGGTIANITALWIARNNIFKPREGFTGIAQEGLFAALKAYNYEGLVILVSERGHYSLSKAADVLGIGRGSLIGIQTDENNKVRADLLEKKCFELQQKNIKVMAIVGVAGTTETGNVDPLDELADIAERYQIHFHVDAAWGGATLLSQKYRGLLNGIQRADSITIDAHKQMYVPMGAGIVLFKDPTVADSIEHHADYILRKGSKDLGSHTLEGSRPGMAMLVHSCLQVIGRQGYGLLIDQSMDKARYFASLIDADQDFELITEPELCLLTYRYVPQQVQQYMRQCSTQEVTELNELLNNLTKFIQKRQREDGKSFVSRTRLLPQKYQRQNIVVLRVVLANPLTTETILQQLLVEQKLLAQQSKVYLPEIMAIIGVKVAGS
jgi:putative pyridoxal-dependent aspartate 1-decarboxylase